MNTPSSGLASRAGFASRFASSPMNARQRWYIAAGTCVLLLVATPVRAQQVTLKGVPTKTPTSELSSSHGQQNPASAAGSQGLSSLPVKAQGPVSAALGRDDSRYWFHANASSVHAVNPRHTLDLNFTQRGVDVSSKGARWSLALRGYGYGDERLTIKQVVPQAKANRIEYERGALTEWYINGPLGLEQGFTLARRPGKADGRPLTVALAVAGDSTAELDADRTAVTVKGRNGQAALRLTGLVAYDAAGRAVKGLFALHGQDLLLQVDDAGAQYPLVVDPFVQQAELTASDGATYDWFGYTVGLSGNGNTALVGAPYHLVNGNSEQGAAYVFTNSGGSWSQQQELTSSDGAAYDDFGWSVALSSDGNTALVGASYHQVNGIPDQGAAYVFTNSGGSWSQQQELTASDGAIADFFGRSVALSGDGNAALVGAFYHTVNGNSGQGASYVFTNSGGSWSQQQELTSSDGAAGDEFGYSVGLSADGNTALAGALSHTVNGNSQQGAAYVFTNSGGSWSQQQELTASDGAVQDFFGFSVALSSDGNTTLVAAYLHTVNGNSQQGAAYVFTNSGGSWSQQQELTASDGAVQDLFGWSVALSSDGNTALVGAYLHTVNGNSQQGAAYVFTNSGGSWGQQQELAASDGAAADRFGSSVALSSDGNTALVGAYAHAVNGKRYQGAAYTFVSSSPTTTAIASNLNPSTYGQSVTFTATINEQNGDVKHRATRQGRAVKPQDVTGTVTWSANTGCGTTTVTSGNPGVATCTTINLVVGTDPITATYSGDSNNNGSTGTLSGGQVVNPLSQTITFTTPPPATAKSGDSFTVSATGGGSGNPVTFSVGASSVCTISGTATYTMTSNTGYCYVVADQAAGGNYAAAPQVTENVMAVSHVTKIAPTVTFTGAPIDAAYLSTFTVAATQNSGITPTITAAPAGTCSISGYTVTINSGTGMCTLTATWVTDDYYLAATLTQKTTAEKLMPTVTFTGAPANAAYLSTFTVATTQNTNVTPTITSTTGTICSVSSGTVTMKKGTGTCTVKASWAANTDYQATSLEQSTSATLLGTTTTITSAVPQATHPLKVEVYFTVINGMNAVTGDVTVSAGTGQTCTGTVTSGKCLLTFTVAGSETLTAVYAGNTNDATSTSAPYTFTVQ